MVWLGIDLGNARVGLSQSDPEHTLAHPLHNIHVNGDSFQAMDDVVRVIIENEITRIVIGLPLQLDGTQGRSANKARRWATNLDRRLRMTFASEHVERPIPAISLVDERLTSVSAHRHLLDAGLRTMLHRRVVDQEAAVLILQSALDRFQAEEAARAR